MELGPEVFGVAFLSVSFLIGGHGVRCSAYFTHFVVPPLVFFVGIGLVVPVTGRCCGRSPRCNVEVLSASLGLMSCGCYRFLVGGVFGHMEL